MTYSFFTPETKVHKQRNIMRATDFRMVRYSRRGIALNLIIFIVCMLLGEYYSRQPSMTAVLMTGLLVTTVCRAYYLFRFENVYPRSPARWRNMYFIITIISGGWWGFILSAVTFELGVAYEVPLLWLFSIVFFSGSSHIFSPFERFYRIYLFVTLLPCSLVAMVSLHAIDSLYGLLMLVLLLLLQRQGVEQGSAYWKLLQANYDLTQRANALEAEKITSQSSLTNKEALFVNFAGELKTSIKEIMGSLQLLKLAKLPDEEQQLVVLAENKSQQQLHMLQNVLEFSHISKKDVRLDADVIDLRAVMEKAISTASDQVYKKQIEIFARFSSEFPQRVRGDDQRLQQIVTNIIMGAMDYVDGGSLLVDVNYTGTIETTGNLRVIFKFDSPLRTPEIEQKLHDAFRPHYASNMTQGLQLAIAKGLATCMQGGAGTEYTRTGELQFWFSVALPTVTPSSAVSDNIIKLNGKRLFLYQPPHIIESEYKNTLESWGLIVDIFYDYETAIAAVKNAKQSGSMFDLMMIYTRIDDLEGIALSRILAAETAPDLIPQLICVTEAQSKSPLIEQLMQDFPHIGLLQKPIGYKQLRQRFKHFLLEGFVDDQGFSSEEGFLQDKKILLLQAEEIDRTIAEVMLKKLGCIVDTVGDSQEMLAQLQSDTYDAVIIDSHMNNVDMKTLVEQAKSYSGGKHTDSYSPPILGLSQHEKEGEETRCLQCGMDYFIDSPLQIDDLRAILRRWIGRATHIAQQE